LKILKGIRSIVVLFRDITRYGCLIIITYLSYRKILFSLALFRTIHRSINNNLFTSSKKYQTRKNKKKEEGKCFDEMPRKNDPYVKIDGGLFVESV
jgi:hypothetical protein